MIPASTAFNDTIRQSHKVVSKCEIYSDGIFQAQLFIVDGNVRVDAKNKFRRTADVKLIDVTGDLTPQSASDLLSPQSGNEFVLYRGVHIPSTGVDEYIQLGSFIIKDTEIYDTGEYLQLTLKGYDRGFRVSKAKLAQPLWIIPGDNVGNAIKHVLTYKWPDIPFANDFTLVCDCFMPGTILDRKTDPWEACIGWATDAGMDLYFNNYGQCTLVKLPEGDPNTNSVVWSYVEGPEAQFLSLRVDLTQDDTFNHTVVTSSPTNGTTPLWAEALITNPGHPLYIGGSFGDTPYFYSSPLFTDQDQVQSVANSLLQQHSGHSEHIHFNALVNPCLEANDLVYIERARANVASYFSMEQLVIPMVAVRAMEADTRVKYISSV